MKNLVCNYYLYQRDYCTSKFSTMLCLEPPFGLSSNYTSYVLKNIAQILTVLARSGWKYLTTWVLNILNVSKTLLLLLRPPFKLQNASF